MLIKATLSGGLIDGELSSSTLTLFAGEVALLLSLLNLVHGSGEGEVLDLTRRDTLLLLLTLNGVIHVDVRVDSELLEVLFEFTETVSHLRGGHVKLFIELSLVNVHLSVFKVLLTGDVARALPLVSLPVFTALHLPLLHEFLIICKFHPVVSALLLLDRLDEGLFCVTLSKSRVKEVLLSDLEVD